jgi:Crinkler effector protein N-terminal domain
MVTLVCAIAGQKGSAFPVTIKENKLVGDLKDAIKRKKERTITCDADMLQLFLGKYSNGMWLDSNTDDVKALKNGEMNAPIKELTHKAKELQGESGIEKVLKGMLA